MSAESAEQVRSIMCTLDDSSRSMRACGSSLPYPLPRYLPARHSRLLCQVRRGRGRAS